MECVWLATAFLRIGLPISAPAQPHFLPVKFTGKVKPHHTRQASTYHEAEPSRPHSKP